MPSIQHSPLILAGCTRLTTTRGGVAKLCLRCAV